MNVYSVYMYVYVYTVFASKHVTRPCHQVYKKIRAPDQLTMKNSRQHELYSLHASVQVPANADHIVFKHVYTYQPASAIHECIQILILDRLNAVSGWIDNLEFVQVANIWFNFYTRGMCRQADKMRSNQLSRCACPPNGAITLEHNMFRL